MSFRSWIMPLNCVSWVKKKKESHYSWISSFKLQLSMPWIQQQLSLSPALRVMSLEKSFVVPFFFFLVLCFRHVPDICLCINDVDGVIKGLLHWYLICSILNIFLCYFICKYIDCCPPKIVFPLKIAFESSTHESNTHKRRRLKETSQICQM